jgi:tetratricopeptide (TPR) repeat protein
VRHAEHGLVEATGQLRFDFVSDGDNAALPWSSLQTADQLFDEALELQDSGHHAEAAEIYRRAIELDPGDPVLYFNLATVHYERGLLEDSAAAYLEATQRDSKYVEAWNAIGCVLSELKRTKEAIVALRRAVELVPDYGDAHYNLAFELESQGEISTAAQHWRRYLQLDRTGPWADIARARLQALERELPMRIPS